MKKIIGFMLAIAFIIAAAPLTVFAGGEVSVTVHGGQVDFPDQGPVIVDGTTLVPVAGVFEALGFDVLWDDYTGQATISREGDTVVITIGSSVFTANGASHNLDVPAQIIGDRTMLPIAVVLRSVGYDVYWDEETRTVAVTQAADTPAATPQVQPSQDIQYAPVGDTDILLTGMRAERVYIHEALGFRFTLPVTWNMLNDAEIEEMIAALEYLADYIDAEETGYMEADDMSVTYFIMVSRCVVTGENVSLTYITGALSGIDEFITNLIEDFEEMANIYTVSNISDISIVEIGNDYWYTYNFESEIMWYNHYIQQHQFVNIKDHGHYVITITTSLNDYTKSPEEILSFFSNLSDPAPPIPQPELSSDIIGRWYWDVSDSYIYIFYGDGAVVRGFDPIFIRYYWFTVDDHLIINMDELFAESWTFTTDGDVLTLESRQIPGMIYNYISSLSDFALQRQHPSDIIGTWHWDVDDMFIYIFHEDGTGVMGFYPELAKFEWFTVDSNRLVIDLVIDMGSFIDYWTFTIDGDVLTMEDRHMPGLFFSYIRG